MSAKTTRFLVIAFICIGSFWALLANSNVERAIQKYEKKHESLKADFDKKVDYEKKKLMKKIELELKRAEKAKDEERITKLEEVRKKIDEDESH